MAGPRNRRPRWGKDAEKYLLADEPPVIATRRHPAVLARPLVRGLPVLLLGGWVLTVDPTNEVTSTVGLVAVLGALAYLGLHIGEWYARHLLITRRRVLLTSGVIIRTVAVMPLRRITDLTWKETFFGQLLGYGTFRFESAGQQQGLDVITFVPHANSLYKRLSELMFGSDVAKGPIGDDDDGSGSVDDGGSARVDPRQGAGARRDTPAHPGAVGHPGSAAHPGTPTRSRGPDTRPLPPVPPSRRGP